MTTRHQAEPIGRSAETLVFRGILSKDLRFTPMGCHTTRIEGPRKPPAPGDLFVELFDREGNLLQREPAAAETPVVCANASPAGALIEGRIPLPDGAAELRFTKGKTLIQSFPIGEAPRIEVAWREEKVDRHRKYPLLLEFSDPTPEAYLKILYEWGEGRYQTAALTRPVKKLDIDFGSLPGGEACRLIVTYTSGMRTAVATTKAFSVPAIPPVLRIARPREKAVFAPWHPVTLEAEWVDRQNGTAEDPDLIWVLNGKKAGAGPLGCLQDLSEGRYELELRLRGRDSLSVRRDFEVRRPEKIRGLPAKEWT